MTCGIYKIVHLASGRCYVGQSIKIERRITGHIKNLNQGKHHSPHLQHAWDKYGPSNFSFEILRECQSNELDKEEQFFIDTLDSTFNVCKIAKTTRGTKRSEQTRELNRKIALAMTPETKEKMSRAAKNKRLSEEHKKKIGDSVRGLKRSQITKEKLRKAALGNQRTLGKNTVPKPSQR